MLVFAVVIGGGGVVVVGVGDNDVVVDFDKSKQEEDEEKKKKAKMSKLNHKNGNHGDGKLEEQGLIDPNENKIGGRLSSTATFSQF